MQGRLITFRQLRPILERHYGCSVDFFPAGAGEDPDGTDSPPVYAFVRDPGGGQVLISTIVVHHDDLPLFQSNLRSFLARLRLTIEDVIPHL